MRTTALSLLLASLLLASVISASAATAATPSPFSDVWIVNLASTGNAAVHDEYKLNGDAAVAFRAAADANGDGQIDAAEAANAGAAHRAPFDGPDASTLLDGASPVVHNAEGLQEELVGPAASNVTLAFPTIYQMNGTLAPGDNHTWQHVVTTMQDVYLNIGVGAQITSVENMTLKDPCHAVATKASNVTVIVRFALSPGACEPPVVFDSHADIVASSPARLHAQIVTHYSNATAATIRKAADSNKDGMLNASERTNYENRSVRAQLANPSDQELSLDGYSMTHVDPTTSYEGLTGASTSSNDTVTGTTGFDLVPSGNASGDTHTLRRWIENDQRGDWTFTVPPGFAITSLANMTSQDSCTATGATTPGTYLVTFAAKAGACPGAAPPTPAGTPTPTPTPAPTTTTPAAATTKGAPAPGLIAVLGALAAIALIASRRRSG